jgi:hypothetical protein
MEQKKIIIELSEINSKVWLESVLKDIKIVCEQRNNPIKMEVFTTTKKFQFKKNK